MQSRMHFLEPFIYLFHKRLRGGLRAEDMEPEGPCRRVGGPQEDAGDEDTLQ